MRNNIKATAVKTTIRTPNNGGPPTNKSKGTKMSLNLGVPSDPHKANSNTFRSQGYSGHGNTRGFGKSGS